MLLNFFLYNSEIKIFKLLKVIISDDGINYYGMLRPETYGMLDHKKTLLHEN